MNIESFFNTADTKRIYFPAKIISGNNSLNKIKELVRDKSIIYIFIDSAVINLPFIKSFLEEIPLDHLHIIESAPTPQDVELFISANSRKIPDVILTIGGGSTIDFAKAVLCIFLFGTLENIGINSNIPNLVSPNRPTLITCPTTAGSGAESSRYFVLYDKHDKHKIHGKNWNLISDWIFLDSRFLESNSDQMIVTCAFDAFIHCFETLVSRYESSNIGNAIAIHTIQQIMISINEVIINKNRTKIAFQNLMESASIAGALISNTRTGNIHEAAGALLEHTSLNHGETLMVFFRTAITQYHKEILPIETSLINTLNFQFNDLHNLEDLIAWWEKIVVETGIQKKIIEHLSPLLDSMPTIKSEIFKRVSSDKVWCLKESPIRLDDRLIEKLINASLDQYY